MSFMFKVRGEDWKNLDSAYPKRTITDIEKIFEVSAVTFPAYEDTSIKARAVSALESAKRELESAREKEKEKELKKAQIDYEIRQRELSILSY